MERILKIAQDKRWRLFFILTSISLLVWFGGPYIAIAGKSFLANVAERLLVILALALFWGAMNLRYNHKVSRSQEINSSSLKTAINSPATAIVDPVIAEIKQLQKDFKDTLRTIRKTLHKNWFATTPCFIALGTAQSGKTSLLTHTSEAKTFLAKEKYFSTWLVKDCVFLDYADNFNQIDSRHSLLWQRFLQSLLRYRHSLHFRGTIITINIVSLVTETEYSKNLLLALQHMATVFSHIPIYLIFTHCDLIAGFTDFFEDSSQEERSQTLGFSFSNLRTTRDFSEIFELQFNTLLKRLNERLIWRMHQEHNAEKRMRIKDFPLQMEILKKSLADLSNQFNNMPNVRVFGCYFTSSAQQQTPINFLNTSLEKVFQLKQPAPHVPKLATKNYFTQAAFPQIIAHGTEFSPQLLFTGKRSALVYGSCGILLILSTLFWYNNYRANMTTINELQTALIQSKQFTLSTTHNDYDILSILQALTTALQKINHHSTWQLNIGLTQGDHIKQAAQNTYETLLLQQFLPILQKSLETQIQNLSTQNPNELYSAVKAYLMLSDLSHRDPQFLQQWFTSYWSTRITNNEIKNQFLQQLQIVLKNNLVIISKPSVINTARNRLNQIPLTQLSYSVLLDHFNQPIFLFENNPALVINNNYQIPVLFTAEKFPEIYNQQITQAVQEVLKGNWILGEKGINQNIDMQQLVNQVQVYYLNQYANAWLGLLNHISIGNFTDIHQAALVVSTLSNPNSPLWQLLNVINVNTAPRADLVQFNLIISNQFQNFNNFSQSSALNNLQNSLSQMKSYLNKIANAGKPTKAAYFAAAKRMQSIDSSDPIENLLSQSPNLPVPLQNWINNLATLSWQLILFNSQEYLNQVWSSTVFPFYQQHLENRYPLFNNANADISLNNFVNFFGPDGIVDNFFNNYLKPFVDTHNVYWTWKTVDNQRIAIPPTTLEMFIRAAVIQKMFFATNNSQPMVKFALMPIALEPGVTDFNLNINGQSIDYQPNTPMIPTQVIWPGNKNNLVIMQFTNDRGQTSRAIEKGTWAWFKLIAKANLQNMTNNPRQYKLIFDLNGSSVQYQLLANDLVNPFISGIVDVFRAPEKL